MSKLKYKFVAIVACLAMISTPALADTNQFCPPSSSSALKFTSSLKVLREVNACGMFTPCTNATVYEPGKLRIAGLNLRHVSWNYQIAPGNGRLTYQFDTNKETVIAALERDVKQTCRKDGNTSCSFSVPRVPGREWLAMKIEYLGGPVAGVQLTCQYWQP